MILIVAGGRDHHMTEEEFGLLKDLCMVLKPDIILTGGQRGVDMTAHFWAIENGYEAPICWADWARYGKAAGPIRNEHMARNADAVVLFPGGHGTQNMFEKAQEWDLMVFDYRN
jgi:hypothetical protein